MSIQAVSLQIEAIAPLSPIRTFLVDDHEIVREGLAALLGRDPTIELVGSASSAEEALDMLPDADPQVIIADVRLPGMDGIDLCREVAERRLRARVVLLSAYLDDESVFSGWLAGASGYVVKDVEAGQLIRAIHAAMSGHRTVDPKVASRLVGWAMRLTPKLSDPLPPSEERLLQLLLQGHTNRQIAERTGLSQNTVKKYLSRIYRRLGVTGRSAAIVEAMRRGFA